RRPRPDVRRFPDAQLIDPRERARALEERRRQWERDLRRLNELAEHAAVVYCLYDGTRERRDEWEDAERDVLTCEGMLAETASLAELIRSGVDLGRRRGAEMEGDTFDIEIERRLLARARRVLRAPDLTRASYRIIAAARSTFWARRTETERCQRRGFVPVTERRRVDIEEMRSTAVQRQAESRGEAPPPQDLTPQTEEPPMAEPAIKRPERHRQPMLPFAELLRRGIDLDFDESFGDAIKAAVGRCKALTSMVH